MERSIRFPPVPGIEHLAPAQRGPAAEVYAAQCLTSQGLRVLGRNLRFPFGEIDILARDGGTLVFVEVRWRRSRQFGGPAASVTPAKRRRLHRAAQAVLQRYRTPPPCRWDAVWAAPAATIWERDIPSLGNAFGTMD